MGMAATASPCSACNSLSRLDPEAFLAQTLEGSQAAMTAIEVVSLIGSHTCC